MAPLADKLFNLPSIAERLAVAPDFLWSYTLNRFISVKEDPVMDVTPGPPKCDHDEFFSDGHSPPELRAIVVGGQPVLFTDQYAKRWAARMMQGKM